jgi:outer membrane protein
VKLDGSGKGKLGTIRLSAAILFALLGRGTPSRAAAADPPIPGPAAERVASVQAHVEDGRLRLSLADAVALLLANDTTVQLARLRHAQTEYSVARAQQPFDPQISSRFDSTRSTSAAPGLALSPIPSVLDQQGRLGLSQLLSTGTRLDMSFSAGRNRTSSLDDLLNPSFSSNLTLSLNQPLLRNFGSFPNRAPVVLAERGVAQSQSGLDGEIADAVTRGVNQYWDVVQARESLRVLQESLKLAEATYEQNKKALELGALPPLDIFRSEQQVATRKLQVIQSEYTLRRLEDTLRRTLGADLDPTLRAVPLELVEPPAPEEPLVSVDEADVLARALARRPELLGARQEVDIRDIRVRLARNQVRPDLSVTGFYSYDGRSGRQLDNGVDPPTVVAQGGLGDALGQLRSRDYPTYGLTLDLRFPLHNRAAEADLATARVARRQGEIALQRQTQDVTLEVRTAVRDLEEAKASMEAARLARDLGEKNLKAEERKYELGAQTIFFVLEAQNQLAQAQVSLLQSEIGYRRVLAALDRATGEVLARFEGDRRPGP